jgi:hypothetical protein
MTEEEIRLDQTKKVFKALADFITIGGGSYRYLIYDKLGFPEENYLDLLDGMDITNAISLLEELKDDEKIEIERLRKNNLRIREIYDAYLWLIIDLALDYDGFNTVEGLKGLIDEIKSYAYMAIDNDTKTPFYKDGDGNDLNILLEKIGK